MTKIPDNWPNNHSWVCECEVCEGLWNLIEEEETREIDEILAHTYTKEYDEEYEHQLSVDHNTGGW